MSSILSIYHRDLPPVAEELLLTRSFCRLKDISMFCGCQYSGFAPFPETKPYSRYEHSLGVAMIVARFDQRPAAIVSALLHDIATPCFAHAIDFLNGDHIAQESTEEETETIIRKDKDMCRILAKHGLSVEEVRDYHRYPIADTDSPSLSADRLEYTLGCGVAFGTLSYEEAAALYNAVTVTNGSCPHLAMKDLASAEALSLVSLQNGLLFASDPDRYAMQYLAVLVKDAIEQGVITRKDLMLTEPELMRLLARDPALKIRLEKLSFLHTIICFREDPFLKQKNASEETLSPKEVFRIPAKKRYIDPLVIGENKPVSQLSESVRLKLQELKTISFDHYIYAQ